MMLGTLPYYNLSQSLSLHNVSCSFSRIFFFFFFFLPPIALVFLGMGVVLYREVAGHKCRFYLYYSIYFSLFYVVKPIVHLNRLSIIWNVICPSHFLYIVFHVVLAGFFASCCTGLLGGRYGTLVRFCEVEGIKECLAEEHLFLVLYGMFTVRQFLEKNSQIRLRKQFIKTLS